MFPAVACDQWSQITVMAADLHAVWLDPAGAQKGAAGREEVPQAGPIEAQKALLEQAEESIADAQDLDAGVAEGGFANRPNRGVQAGTVSSRCEDADAFNFAHTSGFMVGGVLGPGGAGTTEALARE
jgi:hypothetical protein